MIHNIYKMETDLLEGAGGGKGAHICLQEVIKASEGEDGGADATPSPWDTMGW